VIYEWDPKKADENLKRHKVSFDEATTVFTDPFALTFDDPDHSLEERRYATIGTSIEQWSTPATAVPGTLGDFARISQRL
jgi:uncharacterized DUF497 family protein